MRQKRTVLQLLIRPSLAAVLFSSSSPRKLTTSATAVTTTMSSHLVTSSPPVHAPADLLPSWMAKERTRVLNGASVSVDELWNKSDDDKGDSKPSFSSSSSVVYWMQRDVRTVDNWALALAQDMARRRKVPLRVVYALPPPPTESATAAGADEEEEGLLPPALIDMPMTERHGKFLIGGLECVYNELRERNVPLHVVLAKSDGAVGKTVCRMIVDEFGAQAVVCDFSPLRRFRQWTELQAAPLLDEAGVPFVQVDAHNVVPVWVAADKRQVGARTLRPRIHRVINDYLKPAAPGLLADDSPEQCVEPLPGFDRKRYESFLEMDESVPALDWAEPGTGAAMKRFRSFLERGLKKFDTSRNDPNEKNVCSGLSPWINHGHVSFQRLTMEVKKLNKYANGTASYIEEGVVRRELSDNYVYYAPNDYDSLSGAAGWAQETLQVHSSDPREYLYSLRELESAETHDDLWNAAQLQVVREGRMHGFLRMYWAKKILEWTASPEVALRTGQYLNDKYALDGRDPNGFVGVGWSVMGVHDMGWKERPVFGKIRYMNYNGCKRKFKVPAFVAQYKGASENAVKATQKHHQQKKGQKRKSAPS